MLLLYGIAIKLYFLCIFFASFFSKKAKQWIEGRKNIFKKIKLQIGSACDKIIWLHCSSLGEYEQGKPVIEVIRRVYPGHKILLTFFSPSGYIQAIKNPTTDYIFYLPADSKFNAAKFISIIKPAAAFFVKYDFWFYYMDALYKNKIPFYYISAVFRKNQYFFKWYGSFFLKQLAKASHLFVQDDQSRKILLKNNISQVTITGDTRFDKVKQNFLNAKPNLQIEKFIDGKRAIVCGSTWPQDELLLAEYINHCDESIRFIIAPHELNRNQINRFMALCNGKSFLYSESNAETIYNKPVLIVDAIGMLSGLYRYATIAYIGGGFGAGIHNILEPAVFGAPVIFGANYEKFNEAADLVKRGGAFSISNFIEFKTLADKLLNAPGLRGKIQDINKSYVEEKLGASEKTERELMTLVK